ncbi:MAG: hypothetical protein ABJN69_06530 [Hellea sp.]
MLGLTYLLYIGISLAMTFWVGRTLNKNGHVFLMENYNDNAPLAKAINSMLLVGFYMINIGFISYTLKIQDGAPVNYAQVLEFLSLKVGFVAIVLGLMHFALMFALQQYSKARIEIKSRLKDPFIRS